MSAAVIPAKGFLTAKLVKRESMSLRHESCPGPDGIEGPSRLRRLQGDTIGCQGLPQTHKKTAEAGFSRIKWCPREDFSAPSRFQHAVYLDIQRCERRRVDSRIRAICDRGNLCRSHDRLAAAAAEGFAGRKLWRSDDDEHNERIEQASFDAEGVALNRCDARPVHR